MTIFRAISANHGDQMVSTELKFAKQLPVDTDYPLIVIIFTVMRNSLNYDIKSLHKAAISQIS